MKSGGGGEGGGVGGRDDGGSSGGGSDGCFCPPISTLSVTVIPLSSIGTMATTGGFVRGAPGPPLGCSASFIQVFFITVCRPSDRLHYLPPGIWRQDAVSHRETERCASKKQKTLKQHAVRGNRYRFSRARRDPHIVKRDTALHERTTGLSLPFVCSAVLAVCLAFGSVCASPGALVSPFIVCTRAG